MKIFLYILLSCLVVILLLIGGAVIWFTHADLKPYAEEAASEALGRQVVADKLNIEWGDPLHIELTNLRVANAPWGSDEHMITLHSLSADVEAMSLWRGKPAYRYLRASGLKVVLERDSQGIGNWKFDSQASNNNDQFALIPKNRTQFPTLLDMVLNDALITYRTYSGNILRIKLDNVAIATRNESSPVTLKAAGAYNNTPLGLAAETASFIDLRDSKKPFKTTFTLFGKTARLHFDGTQMEPLDFDGVAGELGLQAEELDNLIASFGVEASAEYPFVVDTHLTRQSDHWEFTRAKGKFDQASFKGQLILDEGRKGSPDRLTSKLSFDRLDMNRLLQQKQKSETPLSLSVPKESGVLLDLSLDADTLIYRDVTLNHLELGAHLGPEDMTLEYLRFPYAGGDIQAHLAIAERINAAVTITDVNVDEIAQELGANAGDLTGNMAGRFTLVMPTGDLQQALSQAQGIAVITVRQGSIRRAIVEKLSTDLRMIFRENQETTPVQCLGGVIPIKDGVAYVAPLRLMAKDAIVNAGGSINLVTREIDLRLQSERHSTDFFALDLPLQIKGRFDNLSAGLAKESAQPLKPETQSLPDNIDSDMRRLMKDNACFN